MLALPWTTPNGAAGPAVECTVLATKLRLRSHRDVSRFVRWSLRIRHQLSRTPGLVGYSIALQLLDRTLWTVSAWTDRRELARFDRSGPHRAAKDLLRGVLRPSVLVLWTCPAAQLPVGWPEVRRRIAEAVPDPAT
jgi:hypothetical protein